MKGLPEGAMEAKLPGLIERGALEAIASYLDKLPFETQLREMEAIPARLMPRLFTLARPSLKMEDLIPRETPPLQEVIFHGKNSLPVFSRFQKRLCRSRDGTQLWGYNHQSLGWLTGPGYFVVNDHSDRPSEVMFDYTQPPPETLPHWPTIKSNESGITRLVFGHLKDFVRRVSQHLFIGEATKQGRSIDQYFLLCRK